MSAQSEALRPGSALWLARELDAYSTAPHHKQAAVELRRLQAQRDALLAALKKMRIKYGEYACRVCDQADAAIKAVEETK